MHIHILGACGTFMGGVALLAKRDGHVVSGSDQFTYPPMSTQLEAEDIRLYEGYDPAHLDPAPDLVVIGNALSRGNPAVEYVLDNGLNFTLSMGGGTWAGNSISENLGYQHFINVTHLVTTIEQDKPSEQSLFGSYWQKFGK